MKTFKALISKFGGILSINEDDCQLEENFKIEVAGQSKYPDIVFVKANDKQEAEVSVTKIIEEFSEGK